MTHCIYCKRPFNWLRRKTKDHVFPKSKGGINHPVNYVEACEECNTEKSNQLPDKTTLRFLIVNVKNEINNDNRKWKNTKELYDFLELLQKHYNNS